MNKMLYAILKDSTFATKMDALIAAVKPNAADIPLTPPPGMTADDVEEGITELNSNLTDLNNSSVTLSLNQATGKISSISGSTHRKGNVVEVNLTIGMNNYESSNWIELGTVNVPPTATIRQNFISDNYLTDAKAVRVQIDATTGLIKCFYGGAATYYCSFCYVV